MKVATCLLALGLGGLTLTTPPAAHAAPEERLRGIVASISVANGQLPADHCKYHPVTVNLALDGFKFYTEWDLSVQLYNPQGEPTSMDTTPLPDDFANGVISIPMGHLELCTAIGPGTYTVEGFLYGYVGPYEPDIRYTIPAVPFTVSPGIQDVRGTLLDRDIRNGAMITFRTEKTGENLVEGKKLTWKIKYDGKTKKLTQGAGERDVIRIRFPENSGKHKITVLANGKRALRTTVEA